MCNTTAKKIVDNKVQCIQCGDVVMSIDENDIENCSCGKVSITGGYEKINRFNLVEGVDFKELSTFYIVE